MNEGTTNLSRRKVEAKAEIKRSLLVDLNFTKISNFGKVYTNNGASRTGG